MRYLSIILTAFLMVQFSGMATAKIAPSDHYARMPAFYDAAISPDGNFLATIMDNEGEYLLRVFNLGNPADKKVRGTKYGKDIKVNFVRWANNDTILLNVSTPQKFGTQIIDSGYIYVIDKDVTGAEILLKAEKRGGTGSNISEQTGFRQFNNVVVDYLPDDPDHILMSYGMKDNLIPEVYKMNINSRRAKLVKTGNPSIQSWMSDRNGELRLGEGRKDRNGKWTMNIRDAVGSEWRDVSQYPGLTAETNVMGFTDNPNELILKKYNGKNTQGLFIYDLGLKKQTRKLFQHDKYDVDRLIYSADGKKVVGARFLADAAEAVYFDPSHKAMLKPIETKFQGFQLSYYDSTPDNNKIVFKASAPSVPAMMYLYDASSNSFTPIGEDYPEIGITQQGDVTPLSYKTRDGYKIRAFMTTPPAIGAGTVALKDQPFIIMPHGGPYARDTLSYDFLAQFMASRGYSVLQMNFRGSDGYGAVHELAGRKNWEVMQEDVEDATRWLIKKGYADPDRICFVGWSYGGFAALIGSIKNPELYACAVSIAGVTDLNDHISDMKKYRFGRFSARDFMISGFKDGDNIRENSPVKRGDEMTVPILLVHGTRDTVVEFDQFRRMKRALKKASSKKTFVEIKNGDHSLAKFAHRKQLFDAMDKHLKDNLGASAAAP